MSDQNLTPESSPLVPLNPNGFKYRFQNLSLWALCVILIPIFLTIMFFQILFGDAKFGHNAAVDFDYAANSTIGGLDNETMSSRVGDAYLQGKRWAKFVAPIVDLFFGKGHCLSQVDLPESDLTPEQIQAVNQADAEEGDTPTYPK